jgi:hypothetical protein
MADERGEVGERHLELLRVLSELASEDPDGVAHMHEAAQRAGLDTVSEEAAREEFESLTRDLEEAGYVEVRGTDLAASHGMLSVTEEGRHLLEENRR